MLFLSYRRSDCLAASNALRLALVRRYGSKSVVFRDYEQLEPGQPWSDQLRDSVDNCVAVLALIGKGWDLPRLDEATDWVRREVEAGIAGKKLFPLLVDGASMPAARWNAGCLLNDLPELQAWPLSNALAFAADVDRVCTELEKRHPALKEVAAFRLGRFKLPAVVTDFVGRADEIAALKALLRTSGRAGVSAVKGMGGVGKTTLAAKVATELIPDFDDGIFTLDLQGTGTPRPALELMREVIRIYRPKAQAADDWTPGVFAEVLAGQRVLLLLDNAADESQILPLIAAAPPTVGVLITSRNALEFDNLHMLPLDALSLPEAVELLREVAKRGTDAELEAVAHLCGRLPLALRVAGNFLRLNTHWPVADYIAELTAKRLERLKGKNNPKLDVEAVLKFSLDKLAEKHLEVAARYAQLSVFPADFFDAAAQAVLAVDETTWLDTATVLRDRSLLDFTAGRYLVHDLLRLLAGAGLGEEDKLAAELRFAEHYRDIQYACQKLFMAGNIDNFVLALKLFDTETGNIARGRKWCFTRGSGGEQIATLIRDYLLNAQAVHGLRLTPHEQKGLLEAALPVLKAVGWTTDIARAQVISARILRTQGDLENALALLRESVQTFQGTKCEEEVTVAMGEIAGILQTQGNLDEAMRILEEDVLPVCVGPDKVRSKALTMAQIAGILRDQKKFVEALDIHQQLVLPVLLEISDLPSAAVCMRQIAELHFAQGRVDDAIGTLELVFELSGGLGDLRSVAVTASRIADIEQERGNTDEALRIRRVVELPAYEHLCDMKSLLVLRAQIGKALYERGISADRAEAVEHLRWALAEAVRMQLAEVPTIREWLVEAEGG